MFTKGRIIFALFFVVAFVIALVIMYRKDKKERGENYKGATKIIITILAFLILFVIVIKSLKFL